MARYDKVADPQIRQGLAEAHARMKRGEYTEAVHELSDLFLTIIDRNPAILKRPTPPDSFAVHGGWIDVYSSELRWPQLGANLVPDPSGDGSLRIEYSTDEFVHSQAATYYEFTLKTALEYSMSEV
jgi:hypothetical protein